MKMTKYVAMLTLILLSFLFLTSCGDKEETDLTPKGEINEEVILHNAETVTAQKVKVTVTADAWKGDSTIENYVTPLKFSVENNNEQPIKITYENIDLINKKDNDVYSALPVYKVTGEAENAKLADNYEVVVDAKVKHKEFFVYPLYTGVYTDLPTTDYPFYEDSAFYSEYYNVWDDTGLPTPEMRKEALPEGILAQGGSLSGFIFFQKVDPDLKQVTLSMDIVNAETNKVFGKIEIPFWVIPEENPEE